MNIRHISLLKEQRFKYFHISKCVNLKNLEIFAPEILPLQAVNIDQPSNLFEIWY